MLANITIEGREMGAIFVDYTFDHGSDAQFRDDIIEALKNLSLIGCGGHLETPGTAIYTLLQIVEAFDGKFINIKEGGESCYRISSHLRNEHGKRPPRRAHRDT